MRAVLKTAVVLVGGVLILVAVCALLLGTHTARFVKPTIERHLSDAFGSETTIEGVSFSPVRRTLEIQGLAVANPEPFKKGHAVRFGRIVVECRLNSLLSETPTLERLLLEDGEIHLRYKLAKGTNLGILAQRAAKAAEPQDREGVRKSPRSFRIEELVCKDAKVQLSSNIIPSPPVSLNVVSFTRNDLSKEKPLTTTQIAAIAARSLLTEVVTVKGILKPVLTHIKDELKGLVS
ncbi:MAG TPA: AsmA family protein [Candidatus Hydrogenedentes bacterium]|nr:AsmA family protein [Candidatus Hydrogenedentota bacterium]HIJ73921.1 AsmA family protein [Candidatus Hydrogenedentota bacterium]